MDLYKVDTNFGKTDPIDVFETLLWTERYNDSGEFTLVVAATDAMRALLAPGGFLAIEQSIDVMQIYTNNIKDGMLTATGKTLTDIMKNRLLRNTWSGAADSWVAIGSWPAGQIANFIVTHMMIAGGTLSGSVLTAANATNEFIPHLSVAANPTGPAIIVTVPYGNVFDGVKSVCDIDSLGFRIYPPVLDGSGNVTFATYRGLDRTTGQSTNGQVIFDPAMDSIAETEETYSIDGYITTAYVWPNGITAQSQIVKVDAPGASAFTAWNRRTLMVDASDVNVADYTAANLAIVLQQRGLDALANANYIKMVDGQLVPQSSYVYGTDYKLGDVIELRGPNNTASKARISEYIRSQDSSGEIAYPTLSVVG